MSFELSNLSPLKATEQNINDSKLKKIKLSSHEDLRKVNLSNIINLESVRDPT